MSGFELEHQHELQHERSLIGVPLQPVRATMPNLVGIQYTPIQPPPLTGCPSPYTEIKRLWYTGWRLLLPYFGKKKNSPLLALPPELLLLITSELPDASRASLALTCSALLSTCSDSELFTGLQFPPEQPLEFRSARMSKAEIYQPARWEFLRFLERDSNGKWYLCSECFTLHPRQMFAEYEKSAAPWLKDYYKIKASDFRSCRHGRKNLCDMPLTAYAPSGIVDLCPCVKMTIGKKRRIEARLREDKRSTHGDDRPAAVFWWHKCRHIYGDIDLELQIGFFLYDEPDPNRDSVGVRHKTNMYGKPPRAGDLGVLLEYRHTYPSTSLRTSPRLLCPHHNLDTAIQDLLRCRETHVRPATVCV